jgi:hypothetical protein
MTYAAIIAGAIGTNDPAVLTEVEDLMRHTIFHSTLDWQSRALLEKGAREAYGIYLIQQRARVSVMLPEDEQIARLLSIDPRDVAQLASETA